MKEQKKRGPLGKIWHTVLLILYIPVDLFIWTYREDGTEVLNTHEGYSMFLFVLWTGVMISIVATMFSYNFY